MSAQSHVGLYYNVNWKKFAPIKLMQGVLDQIRAHVLIISLIQLGLWRFYRDGTSLGSNWPTTALDVLLFKEGQVFEGHRKNLEVQQQPCSSLSSFLCIQLRPEHYMVKFLPSPHSHGRRHFVETHLVLIVMQTSREWLAFSSFFDLLRQRKEVWKLSSMGPIL